MECLIIGSTTYARQTEDYLAEAFGAQRQVLRLDHGDAGLDRAIGRARWIIEMTGCDPVVKRATLRRCAALGDATVTSDSSVHRRAGLLRDLSHDFHQRFAVAHFFFPLRHCPVVELITEAAATAPCDPARVAVLTGLLTNELSREVIPLADGPGFLANRLAFFMLAMLIGEASERQVNCAQLDTLLHRIGLSRLGAFALADAIGHAQLADLLQELGVELPADDPFQRFRANAVAVLQATAGAPFVDRATRTAKLFGALQSDTAALDPAHVVATMLSYRRRIEDDLGLASATSARIMALSYGWSLAR